jgi:hypothetical protein
MNKGVCDTFVAAAGEQSVRGQVETPSSVAPAADASSHWCRNSALKARHCGPRGLTDAQWWSISDTTPPELDAWDTRTDP